jgi:hypothetical protein
MHPLENILGAAQVGGVLLLSPALRSWYNRWGSNSEEFASPLPGDELVPLPQIGYTRAITIQAPPERVWPWLAQIGQGRGGFYSFDGLENLAGCRIHSAGKILPEFQDLKVGDLIRLGPPGYPCFIAATVEPAEALVLISAEPKSEQLVQWDPQAGKAYSIATWQFILQAKAGSATRLLVRQRLAYSPDLALMWRLVEPVNFVMERKMLLGIRLRCAGARARG